ncbi:MAG: 4Fe-4S dicluster domain-containing protein [Calditrichaeota bacterium]|nr:4Fe-4S dicluster domain-containing protein [Calditrichota bacterium]
MNHKNRLKHRPSANDTIELLDDPDYVVIPLEYPGRILYKPTVKIGDQVYKNQIIGKSPLGHCIHASISGIVRDILAIWTANIFHVPAILIQKNDQPALNTDQVFEQADTSFEKASTIEKLKILGVISPWNRPGRLQKEDEKTFPSIEKIVIKAFDEEPTIAIGDLILRNFTDKIIRGISYLKNLAPQAEMTLVISQYLADWGTLNYSAYTSVKTVSSEYRDRLSQLVVSKITGVNIPTSSAYRTHGIAVISVEYLLNLVDALDGHRPFISKFLTLSDSGNGEYRTFKFPLGTTIRQLLKAANITDRSFPEIIVGGPMQGITQYTDLTPLTKTSHGLYLKTKTDVSAETNLTCQNCGKCSRICPLHLQVHLLGRYAEYGMFKEAVDLHPEACLDCGLCAYICPARRSLVQLIQMCKKYGGLVDEFPQQQAECGASSALERWELGFQDATELDSRPVTSSTD